jgi:predicted MPP superfamily phosphohydrolase
MMLPMKLWKRLLLAVLLAGLHLFTLDFSTFAQSIPFLFWPSLAVRVLALLVAAPALCVRGLLDIKMGLALPIWLCLLGLHLVLPYVLERGRNAWRVLKAPTVRSRRNLFVGAGFLAAGATGVARETTHLEIRRQELALPDLPSELSGLKVALVADLHRGPAVSQNFLEEVVSRVNSLRPDLVLMPGDFVSKSPSYFKDITSALKGLNPRIGSFATLGNHDIWEGRDEATVALEAAGVRLLQNRSTYLSRLLQITDTPCQGLCLAGVDDLWAGEPDLDMALGSVPSEVPVILLSHNPDVAETQNDSRVDVQFSGHTHGGQIVLPGLGPLATASAHGTKYVSGWAQGPRWKVFTTVGVGTSTIPVRVGASPEIVLFTLVGAELTSRQKTTG